MLAWSTLRRRRRAIAVLVVLVAVAGGFALAATAGARRTVDAARAGVAAANSGDLVVTGDTVDVPSLDRIARVDGVEQVARAAAYMAFFVGVPPDFWAVPIASSEPDLLYEVNRPRVTSGRLPHPERPFEVALATTTASALDASVGDSLRLETTRQAAFDRWLRETDGAGAPPTDGPDFELEVVGLYRSIEDVAGHANDAGTVFLTPAFAPWAEREEIGHLTHLAFVDLAEGADVATVTPAIRALDDDLVVETTFSGTARTSGLQPTLDVVGLALVLGAGAVMLAAGYVTVQAFTRIGGEVAEEDHQLRTLGVGRRTRLAVLVVPGLAVAVVGALGAAAVAALASRWFPFGVARQLHPDPGFDVDLVVLGGGAAAIALVAGLTTGVASVIGARRAQRVRRPRGMRSGPLTLRLGLWMASRRVNGPVITSAVLAAVIGVAGVTAASVHAASLDRLLSSPEMYGWPWDLSVDGPGADDLDLSADPRVAATQRGLFNIELDIDGRPVFAIATSDRFAPVVVRGRPPDTPEEIALGRTTMDQLGVALGSQVRVSSHGVERDLSVVGQVVRPVPTDGGSLAEGAAISHDGAHALGADECTNDDSCFGALLVVLAEGADVDDARRGIEAAATAEVFVNGPRTPGELGRLRDVSALPTVLALVLGVLAVGGVAHAATVVVRRNQRELAVLRCLGIRPVTARVLVAVQATVLVAAGGVLGVLAGIVVGRGLWHWISDGLGVPAVPDVPVALLAVLAASVILAANAAVSVPGRRASRVAPSLALRAE